MKEKKIATITFHRAENHGSALQTFALQHFITNLSKEVIVDYSVIDLTSHSQTEIYSLYKKTSSITDFIKNCISAFYKKELITRKYKFDNFLMEHVNLTAQFNDSRCAAKVLNNYDCLISGSDQIWNVRARDFADFYYLDFVTRAKRISYAASFGPLKIDWSKYDVEKYAALLNNYQYISVRERGSAHNVKHLTSRSCEIHVDPTLLLDVEDWRKIQSDANYNNGQYILLYCLEPSKAQLRMAKAISKKLNLPIVALRYNNKNDIVNTFVKRYDAGPQDFLAYMDHAALVITSSFHGTAFSIIYRKPFYVLDGMNDNRISNLLEGTGLTTRAIDSTFNPESAEILPLDTDKIDAYLMQERERSKTYLIEAIDL